LEPKLSPNRIAKKLRCSDKAMRFWFKRFRETRDIEELPKRVTIEEDDDDAIVEAIE
jgi:hypothetical protein